MSMSVSKFRELVQPKMHGTSLSKVSGFNDKLSEAAGNMLARVRPPTIIRRSRIENAIYDKVFNYSVNDDVELGNIIDVRPIGERDKDDDITHTLSKKFDINKEKDHMTIEYVNGQKTLRISKDLKNRTVLHKLDSTTVGGTVTLGGDASDADIDELEYIAGSGSLKFNLSGATGQATITIALDNKTDLEDLEDVGALFTWLNFPDISRLTNVDMKWGSSASTYWSKTETAFHDRSFTSVGDNGWGLLRFPWVDASESGSPDSDDAGEIDYIQITINYTSGSSLSNARLDNVTASLGEAWEILYYSTYLFTDSTGETWKEVPDANSDLIRLNRGDGGINILLYEFMLTLGQELKGRNVDADLTWFESKLEGNSDTEPAGKPGMYDTFEQKYPDQSLIVEHRYYEFDSLDGY